MLNTSFCDYFKLKVFHWQVIAGLILVQDVQPYLSLGSGRATK